MERTNRKARDFRLNEIGKVFTSISLKDQGGGRYVGEVKAPKEGFTAYFIELTFSENRSSPIMITTEVGVIPDQLPFSLEKSKDKGPIKDTP